MTGSNKASLQRRCADAGLSTEGIKRDLTARLKTSKSVGVVEAIIYKEAVRLAETGKASKAYLLRAGDLVQKFRIDWPQSNSLAIRNRFLVRFSETNIQLSIPPASRKKVEHFLVNTALTLPAILQGMRIIVNANTQANKIQGAQTASGIDQSGLTERT